MSLSIISIPSQNDCPSSQALKCIVCSFENREDLFADYDEINIASNIDFVNQETPFPDSVIALIHKLIPFAMSHVDLPFLGSMVANFALFGLEFEPQYAFGGGQIRSGATAEVLHTAKFHWAMLYPNDDYTSITIALLDSPY